MKGYELGNDPGSKIVGEVGGINFEGNIIPPSWFDHITYEGGKPHVNAVIILSEIVYWYRPMILRDESTLQVLGYRKKFKGKYLQMDRGTVAQRFGLTPKQAGDALNRLAQLGIIKKHIVKSMISDKGVKMGNVPFVELLPERLKNITNPLTSKAIPSNIEVIPSDLQGRGYIPTGETNTENTTDNTTETTTDIFPAPRGGKKKASSPDTVKAKSNGSSSKKEPTEEGRAASAMIARYAELLTYPIPHPGREAGAALRIVRQGYSVEDMEGCYLHEKSQPYWATKHMTLDNVLSKLGNWKATHARPVASTTPTDEEYADYMKRLQEMNPDRDLSHLLK